MVDRRRGALTDPIHLRPAALVLVCAGGAVGTAAREALALSIPSIAGIPVIIGVINVVGAFLLGLLLDSLVRRGPDHGHRRALRLLVGTGALGGFTTYSTLATDSASLVGAGVAGTGSLLSAVGYAVGSVVLGVAAAGLGVVCASALHRRARAGRTSEAAA